MTLAELLTRLRTARRSVDFADGQLSAAWRGGDGSAELTAAAEGSLPGFTLRAYNGGLLQIGWGYPVVVDLAGMQVTKKSRPIFRDHSPAKVVGHSTDITIDARKLTVAGIVSGTGPDAVEVVANAKNGFPWQASIGCSVLKAQFIEDKQSVEANGKTWKGPVYLVTACVLNEVSFVALGGDDTTSALVASATTESTPTKDPSMHPDFIKWLEAKGFDSKTITAAQQTSLEAAWKAEVAAAKPPVADQAKPPVAGPADDAAPEKALTDRLRAAAAAETERLAAIHTAAAGDAKLEAQAIREGWSAEKTELQALRANRPTAPAGIVIPGGNASPKVIEAAACLALGLKGQSLSASFDDRTLEAASKMRGIGLQDILLMAAAAAGYSVRPGCIRSDLGGVLRAAFSSADIAGILSNTANKFILDSFMAVEQVWRQIAAIRPARDFKTMTSYRLTGNLQYEKVGATGEIKHGTLGNDPMTNKVDTHAKMLAISRQDMINDDLGALQKIPAMLGRGAGLQLNEVFWTEFLADNTTFFTLARGNYMEGAGTVLNVDQLTALELLFLNMLDSDGKPLGITPRFLLTPNALSVKAAEICNSTEVRDTTASTKIGTSNPHAGKFSPIRSSYLHNAKMGGGYSATAWYLVADPRDLAAIEVAFLNGVETPTIESSDVDFDTLGIQMRGYHDFGVKKQEYRAIAKSKGAA
jgi:hypothetical protein